jgi:SAM-dependent methyltransferase
VTVFGGYSRYYDLLYRDKDYARESKWIAETIRRHVPTASSVLEIGCGTGLHAAFLAADGLDVTGVDMSRGMLEAAAERKSELPADIASRLSFHEGDARTVRLGRTFDVVISLFHVMSYQTSNADLAAAMATARAHVRDGGAFIFDCWYGPAVLRQWPAVTTKEFSDDETVVKRTATPVVHPTTNIVDVNYAVTITDRATGAIEELRETHHMRYLFSPEIEQAVERAGMRLVESRGWLTESEPGFDTWGACFTARA